MKAFLSILMAILFNSMTGATIGAVAGVDPVIGAAAMNTIGVIAGFIPMPEGFRVGVLTEVWTGELIKSLRAGLDGSWLDGIPDVSSVVEAAVIDLVDVVVYPEVLVNNTTYPIAVQELADGDKTFSLDKFQTKVTPIPDDELYALSYDKMARVKESHANAINDMKFAKAAHSICCDQAAKVKTTGAADSDGRKTLIIKDLVNMKKAMDKQNVPAVGRRLVLCTDHINDLLGISENFARQYNLDPVNGRVARLAGFDIYEYANTPVYTTDGVKQALGTLPDANKFHCSFAFFDKRVFKATGSTKMYYSEANTDPQNQRNLINFRHYFLAMPKKEDAMAVLISDKAAA